MQTQNLTIEYGGRLLAGFAFAELPLDAALQVACQQIDQSADLARRLVLGDTLRALEYQTAAQEAATFAQGNYEGVVPPTVQAWMDAASLEAKPAADNILAKAEAWKGAMYQIRVHRLKGKQDVLKATTHAAVEAIADAAMLAIHASVQGVGNAA